MTSAPEDFGVLSCILRVFDSLERFLESLGVNLLRIWDHRTP